MWTDEEYEAMIVAVCLFLSAIIIFSVVYLNQYGGPNGQ